VECSMVFQYFDVDGMVPCLVALEQQGNVTLAERVDDNTVLFSVLPSTEIGISRCGFHLYSMFFLHQPVTK